MFYLRNSKSLREATPPSFVHPDQQLIEIWRKNAKRERCKSDGERADVNQFYKSSM